CAPPGGPHSFPTRRSSDLGEQQLDAMLGTHCPNMLYPFARQTISELITGGGFPPFLLQPINFDALYAESLRQRAQQQQEQAKDRSEEHTSELQSRENLVCR